MRERKSSASRDVAPRRLAAAMMHMDEAQRARFEKNQMETAPAERRQAHAADRRRSIFPSGDCQQCLMLLCGQTHLRRGRFAEGQKTAQLPAEGGDRGIIVRARQTHNFTNRQSRLPTYSFIS